MTDYPAEGLPPPQLAPQIAAFIAATQKQAWTEHSWACAWNPSLRTIDGARLIGRGATHRTVTHTTRDVRAGELLVHSHPRGSLDPSDADLDHATEWDALGVGFGIIDQDATRLYVLREPRPPEAPKVKTRFWRLGRLLVMWTAPARA